MKAMQKKVQCNRSEKRASTKRKVISMLSHPFLPSLHAHFQSENHVFFTWIYAIEGNGHIMPTDFDVSLVLPDNKPKDMPFSERKRTHKKTLSVTTVCRSHLFVGTDKYVAPEVLCGKGHGFFVDSWTFGIFLYEMVCGKTPLTLQGSQSKENNLQHSLWRASVPFTIISVYRLERKLLVKEPKARLGSSHGAKEIKKHPYFKGTAWKHLNKVARPPFMPPPAHVHIHKTLNAAKMSCRSQQILFLVNGIQVLILPRVSSLRT
ncbi:hypothetical protein L7F22_011925 [Adiantum nelumboides]|nr:hypothetical protein [Adiantum nelumboides]